MECNRTSGTGDILLYTAGEKKRLSRLLSNVDLIIIDKPQPCNTDLKQNYSIKILITLDTHEKLQGVVSATGQYNCSPSTTMANESCHLCNSRPMRYELIQESDAEPLSKYYQY